MLKPNKVVGQVNFTCGACGGSNLKLIGGVKTADEKTYVVCLCDCGENMPLHLDSIILKLYELAPPKLTN